MPDGKHIIYNSYNGNKQLTKLTDYFGNTTSYTYDTWGRLTGYSDSLGKTASYGYYSDGLRRQKTVENTTIKYYSIRHVVPSFNGCSVSRLALQKSSECLI